MTTVYVRPSESSSHYVLRVLRNFGICQLGYAIDSEYKSAQARDFASLMRTDVIVQIEPDKELACADALWRLIGEEALAVLWSNSAEVNEMLTEPATLMRVARRFRRVSSRYQDSGHARGACGPASHAFIGLLRQAKVANQAIGTDYWVHGEGAMHEWVRIGRICIDWTQRQLDPSCGFPHVYIDTSISPLVRPLP